MIPYARITDKTVQRTVIHQDLIHRALIVGVAGHIAFHRQHMIAKALAQAGDFGWRKFQRGNLRTFFNKAFDQRQAQARAAAGNKDDVIA